MRQLGHGQGSLQGTLLLRGVEETGVPAGLTTAPACASLEPAAVSSSPSRHRQDQLCRPGHRQIWLLLQLRAELHAACYLTPPRSLASFRQVVRGYSEKHTQEDPPDRHQPPDLSLQGKAGQSLRHREGGQWAQVTQQTTRIPPVSLYSGVTPHPLGYAAPSQHQPSPALPRTRPAVLQQQ